MTFLAMIIALLIERLLGDRERLREPHWYHAYAAWLQRTLGPGNWSGTLGVLLVVAPQQQVRGYPRAGDFAEIRVRGCGQRVREQALDPRAAVLARRQADAMDHDQRDFGPRGPRVAVRGNHAARAAQPAVDDRVRC